MGRVLRATMMAAAVAMVTAAALPAWAQNQPNDVDLSGFIDGDDFFVEDGQVWGEANRDEEGFEQFSRDLGQVFAPRPQAPSKTLGQAGFAFDYKLGLATVPSDEPYWSDGLAGGQPRSVLVSHHLGVRKGLPFSFEVGGDLSHLMNSQMFGMGANIRWALHEGYRFFPDVGVRAAANTVTGAKELNLINGAWDISLSKSFGIAGVMSLTPYGGYQQLHTWASSRVLSANPQDPRPPVTRDETLSYSPDVVFDAGRQWENRIFMGAEFQTWNVAMSLEAIFALSDPVSQVTLSAGMDF